MHKLLAKQLARVRKTTGEVDVDELLALAARVFVAPGWMISVRPPNVSSICACDVAQSSAGTPRSCSMLL